MRGVERGAQGHLLEQGDAGGNLPTRADNMIQKRCTRNHVPENMMPFDWEIKA